MGEVEIYADEGVQEALDRALDAIDDYHGAALDLLAEKGTGDEVLDEMDSLAGPMNEPIADLIREMRRQLGISDS